MSVLEYKKIVYIFFFFINEKSQFKSVLYMVSLEIFNGTYGFIDLSLLTLCYIILSKNYLILLVNLT